MRVSTVSDDQVAIITSPKRRRLSPNTSGLVDSDDENFDGSTSPYTPLRGRSLGLEPEGASDEEEEENEALIAQPSTSIISCDLDDEDDDARAAPAVELNVCRACGVALDSFSDYTRHMQQVHNLMLQSPPPPSTSKTSSGKGDVADGAPRRPGRPSAASRPGPGRPRSTAKKMVPGETPPDKENGPPKNLPCPTCDRCFTDEGQLRQHMRWSHSELLTSLPADTKPKGRGRGRKVKVKTADELATEIPGSSPIVPSWSAALTSSSPQTLLCPLCPDRPSFISADAREAHLASDHDGERAFGCQSCGETFSLFYELQLHTRQEHDGGESPALVEDPARAKLAYKCVVCKVGFQVEAVLQRHYDAMHTLDEGEQYHCPVCYFTYSGCRTRDDHVLKKHPDARAFKCPVCEARFASFEVFRAHEKRAHISQKTRIRGGMGAGESGVSLLGLPEKPKKPPRRKLAAAMRGALAEKSNDTPEVLAQKRRESRVYKEGTLLCEKCNEDCANEEELDIHTKEHVRKEKRFGCTQCGRVFSGTFARSFLVDHIKLEHMHQSPYTCDDCGQRFLYKVQADRHRTVDRDSGVASCRRAEDLPLNLPRLVFGCSRCAKIFAGEGAQSRYSEHQLECIGTPPAPGPSVRHTTPEVTRPPPSRALDETQLGGGTKSEPVIVEEPRVRAELASAPGVVSASAEPEVPQTVIVLPSSGEEAPEDAETATAAEDVEGDAGEQVVVLSEDVLSDVRAAAASQGGAVAGGSVVLIQAEDGTLIVASEEQLAELQMTGTETETAQIVEDDTVGDETGRTVRQLLQEKRMREASLLEPDQPAPESG